MAKRLVFVPIKSGSPFVKNVPITFTWVSGQALSQVQKCIRSLHDAAKKEQNIDPILEVSTKSDSPLGVCLSAFNLRFRAPNGQEMSVECAFQGSKVFERGGPYTDLYYVTSRQAKKDERLRNSGRLIGFNFLGEEFPTDPPTAFYDWLYLQALHQEHNAQLAQELLDYNGFTDIAFNPEKSLNCQARSAALYVALYYIGEIEKVIQSKEYYFNLIGAKSTE